jgi:hypothetical protein
MILDSSGRPIRKEEIEQAISGKRVSPAMMMSALDLFNKFGTPQSDSYDDYGPFAIANEYGHLRTDEEQADFAVSGSSPYANLNDRFAHTNPISQLNVPRDTRGLMTISLRHANENYIVARSVRIKKNFALRELQFIGTPTRRAFYESEFRRLRMRKILSNVFRYYWITGRVVVYWGDERPIQRISVLDPRYVLVRRVLGKEMVFLIPDPRWKGILERGKGASPTSPEAQQAQFLKKNLPRYWLPYIESAQPIPLKEDSYALIENDLDAFSTRGIDAPAGLPLEPVFRELSTLNMLSVAWMLKHMIVLVSIGDPKAEGQNYTRPDQTELAKLQASFQRSEYAMYAYVDPTVDVRFIAPDPKIFDQAKYQHSVEAIEYCLGVPPIFSRDAEGDFASSSLSLKAFREEINVGRADVVDQLFSKLLPIMREGYTSRKTGGDKDPEVSFDQDCLKDDKVLQDEINGKYDRGAISMESLIRGKAADLETEMARKEDEQQKYGTTARPIWDLNHGTLTSDKPLPELSAQMKKAPGKPGRPTTTGKPTSEKTTGSPTPRPSKA